MCSLCFQHVWVCVCLFINCLLNCSRGNFNNKALFVDTKEQQHTKHKRQNEQHKYSSIKHKRRNWWKNINNLICFVKLMLSYVFYVFFFFLCFGIIGMAFLCYFSPLTVSSPSSRLSIFSRIYDEFMNSFFLNFMQFM